MRIAIASALLCATAFAMGIRGDAHVVAWSRDGEAFLVEKLLHGPEGGGAIHYYFVSRAELIAAKISANFGDGGGGKPQTVKAAACRDAAQRLARALGDRFPGVTTRPELCDQRDRSGVVTVEKPLTGGKLRVEVNRDKVRIVDPAGARREWWLNE